MGLRFNPPPNWPPPPPGFVPPPRWQPDPAWPPPPPGWQLWVPDDSVPGGPDFAGGAAGPRTFPASPVEFAPRRGDFAAGPGDFAAGPGDFAAGAPTVLDPAGPPGTYPGGPHSQQAGPDAPGHQRRRTNGFAIAAFVLGLVGASILGFIFAIVALVQTRRSRQRGKGLAIAGLVLSFIWGAAQADYLIRHSPGSPAKQPASAGTHSPSPASSPSTGP